MGTCPPKVYGGDAHGCSHAPAGERTQEETTVKAKKPKGTIITSPFRYLNSNTDAIIFFWRGRGFQNHLFQNCASTNALSPPSATRCCGDLKLVWFFIFSFINLSVTVCPYTTDKCCHWYYCFTLKVNNSMSSTTVSQIPYSWPFSFSHRASVGWESHAEPGY